MAKESNPNGVKRKYSINIPKVYEISKKSKGYIYIIKIGVYIKVGSTKSLKGRLECYERVPPFKYELLLAREVEDCKFYERAIQKCLIELQVKGEWFYIPARWVNPKKGAKDILKYVDKEIIRQIKSKAKING